MLSKRLLICAVLGIVLLPLLAATLAAAPVHDHAAMLAGNAAGNGAGGAAPAGASFGSLWEIYTPRRICMNLEADVIYMHLISDAIIAVSYFTIPVALIYFVKRRKDVEFNWVFVAFAVFIVACGVTHVFNVVAIWNPLYRLEGFVKMVTALASVVTAIALWPLLPKAIALPSPRTLQVANENLQRVTNELEERVGQRTRDLEQANVSLRGQMEKLKTAEVAQARLAAIVESSSDAIIGRTLNGIITDWNTGARDIFGYEAEEIVGKSILELVPQDLHGEEAVILSRVKDGERIAQFETVRCKKDGTRIHVALTASPIRDNEGRIIGAAKIARDITQFKQAEIERERLLVSEKNARAEAEGASRLKDEFVATLSHELRTPINAVLGWTQILKSPSASVETWEEGLPIIERNVRVQVQLIEDLLDMSRVLSGKLRLDVRRVQLADVIEAAIQTVTPSADAKGIRIQKIIDTRASEVSGDANRLQQIVWNLLANAIKFTPRGGRVQVKLERVNSHVEIVVSDTGMGIKGDFLPHVFERFRQADGSTTRAHGGLGLGLAIVKHLAELHGGSVMVESAGEGQGASFFVMLPCPAVQDSRPEEERVHPTAEMEVGEVQTPSLDALRILAVDDDADARHLLKRVLEEFGAHVIVAGSAREAYRVIQEEKLDVIISDIGMPEEDGYAFIKKLRTIPRAQGGGTPAIALTAFARAEDRRKALLMGFQMHVAKPVDPTELIAVVASVAALRIRDEG